MGRPPLPSFGQCPKENIFLKEVFPKQEHKLLYNISSSHYKILELEYNLEYKLLDNIFLLQAGKYMNLEKQADLTGGQTFLAGPKCGCGMVQF